MSTRSTIAIENIDGTVTSIYCHNDGYPYGPHGVGAKLLTFWSLPGRIIALMKLGSLSELGADIGKKHPFGSRPDYAKTWCKAYELDRGDLGMEAVVHANFAAFNDAADEEYAYCWRRGAMPTALPVGHVVTAQDNDAISAANVAKALGGMWMGRAQRGTWMPIQDLIRSVVGTVE